MGGPKDEIVKHSGGRRTGGNATIRRAAKICPGKVIGVIGCPASPLCCLLPPSQMFLQNQPPKTDIKLTYSLSHSISARANDSAP